MPHRNTIQEYLNDYLKSYDTMIDRSDDFSMHIKFKNSNDLFKFQAQAESVQWVITIVEKHNQLSCYLKK